MPGNNYDYRPFLAALLCSAGAMLAWCACARLLNRAFDIHGPGISGLLMRVPGAKWVTATPHWPPEAYLPPAAGKGLESGGSCVSAKDAAVEGKQVLNVV
jgi:hypothetical protein